MYKSTKNFQDKLKQKILLYTSIVITVLLVLFLCALILYENSAVENQADNVNKYLSELFTSTYSDYKNFLISVAGNENFKNFMLNNNNESQIYYTYYNFNIDMKIKSNLVLTDYDGNTLLETFYIDRNNNYFRSFSDIMRDKVLNSTNPNKIESGLYSFIETSSEYVISGPVMNNGNIIGFVSLYLSGDDWNYELSGQEYNGIITDKFGNVIATSSKMIVDKINKFVPEKSNTRIYIDDTEYYVKHRRLPEQDINIYSLVKVKANTYLYLFGAGIILIVGFLMLGVTEFFSRRIAMNTSRSINKLIDEISVIMKGNLKYKINLDTGDEIETIAENIDNLVERINTLNERNTELINTRRISEIKQLEAQFNPHFLYNTLETIKYSISYDQQVASELISLLTQVLRYSISKGPDEERFGESLEYTKVFLRIYKYRFGKNFNYTIDTSDKCSDIPVPKLLLQPIIENSIQYGFKKKARLNIGIIAKIEDGYLLITVKDDGPGISGEELVIINSHLREQTGGTDHLGLYNTARRLVLHYGDMSGIHLESRINEGTRVIIRIKTENSYQEGEAVV